MARIHITQAFEALDLIVYREYGTPGRGSRTGARSQSAYQRHRPRPAGRNQDPAARSGGKRPDDPGTKAVGLTPDVRRT